MPRIAPDWLSEPRNRRVNELLAQAGYHGLFVGGCVRNSLLGEPVSDIDIASNARPGEVTAVMEAAGLRVVPTGAAHGTVTVLVDHQPYEVTTFRHDVETHGRHAKVNFADEVDEDAHRRDFTINAIYCDLDGTLIDPLGGLPDIDSRTVRFVGTAANRVQEDFLRILRFFRFIAWYGDPQNGIEPEGLAACAEFAAELARISPERIGAEMLKLLSAANPGPAVAAMAQAGVLAQVLPGAEARYLAPFIHLHPAPDPIARLAALGGSGQADALRLSRVQNKRLTTLSEHIGSALQAGELGYRLGDKDAMVVLALRAAFFENPLNPADTETVFRGAQAKFPIAAADLPPGFNGPEIGKRLKELEQRWISSGFTLSKTELLSSGGG